MSQTCELCKSEKPTDAEYVVYLKADKKQQIPTYLCRIHAWAVGAENYLSGCCFPEKIAKETPP